jgi:hypothetical protein
MEKSNTEFWGMWALNAGDVTYYWNYSLSTKT